MEFVNLTPHTVKIENPYMSMTFQPSGTVSRVEMEYGTEFIELEVGGGMTVSVPYQTTPKAKVVNLPEPRPGVIYIVSSYVAQVVKRNDLLSPLTDNTAERDGSGNIVSVKQLRSHSFDRQITFENNGRDRYE